ncbi:MAG: YkgJ family cysteine cluster protein, partial [Promethearchaeia archaeon]
MTSRRQKLSKKLEQGLHFSCQMCGKCCRGLKQGEVYLYRDDLETLAAHLGYTSEEGLKEFARKYISIATKSYYWKAPNRSRGKSRYINVLSFKLTGENEECQFLEDDKCGVYEARPFQCRSFPIGWKMLMTTRKNFLRYAKKCPGLKLSRKNKGNFHSKKEIRDWMRQEEEMEENYFLELKKADFDIFRV